MKPYYEHAGITIYHGDCREILPTLEQESVDLVITDPPYAREFEWCWAALSDGIHRPMKSGTALFTYCGHYQLPIVLREIGRNLTYWWLFIIRNISCPLLFGYNLRATFKTVPAFFKDHQPRHLLPGLFADDLKISGSVRTAKALHKWGQAPIHEPVLRFCPVGGIVLDPFMGSGTILWSAKLNGRRAIGIEIEERYCDIAASRLSQEVFNFESYPIVTKADPVPEGDLHGLFASQGLPDAIRAIRRQDT